ncbi:hypothetical protein OG589_40045 [Sphaerisporangium sp. NBC_01403]|uniref:hypothetical protein n=1 Tax=Sphaerisporangium sp. NBC_01403 TaxID=2903599 RepID=UPI00324E6BF4
MTLPPQAALAMQVIGLDPAILPNTDGMDEQASQLRTVAAGADRAAGDAEGTMRQAQQLYRGESGAAMADDWQRTGNSGGHLSQAGAVANRIPAALDGLSGVAKITELALGAEALYATYRAGRELLIGGPTGPARASVQLLLGRHKSNLIVHELREGTGKVLARAIREKILGPLQGLLRNMKGPRGPMPNAVGAGGRIDVPVSGGRFMEQAGPRGGHTLRMGRKGWFSPGGGTPRASDKAMKAAENLVEQDVRLAEREAKMLDEMADRKTSSARRRREEGDVESANSLVDGALKDRTEAKIVRRGRRN